MKITFDVDDETIKIMKELNVLAGGSYRDFSVFFKICLQEELRNYKENM